VNGTNPGAVDVEALLATLPDCEGFHKLLEQESQCKHFIEADGPPVVAFVKGYGVTQMTDPAPAFEQAWNWEADVKGGAAPISKSRTAPKPISCGRAAPTKATSYGSKPGAAGTAARIHLGSPDLAAASPLRAVHEDHNAPHREVRFVAVMKA